MLVHVQLDGSERTVSVTDLEDLIRSGDVGPETPVRSDTLTAGEWRPARTLSLFEALQADPRALLQRAWASAGVPWFTVLLVGLQLRVFLWIRGTAVEEAVLTRLARHTPSIVERHELERLLTYGAFHSGFDHLSANLLFIAFVGAALERVVGPLHLAILFFSSVFWGGVLSSLLSPQSASIGASAGDFGYLAAAAVFGLRWAEVVPPRARPRFGFVLVFYAAWSLINGILARGGIDNWAHLGGLCAGALHMWALRPDVGPSWKRHNLRVSFIVALLVGVGFVGMARVPIQLTPASDDGLIAPRPVWWTVGWSATGDTAWLSPVTDGVVVVRTTQGESPTTAATQVSSLLEDYRAVDASAALQSELPVERAGVEGRRVRLGYVLDGRPRRVEAEVFARGRFAHRVVVDTPAGEPRVAAVANAIFADIQLPVPEEVEEARRAGESWRGRVRRAEAESAIGEPRVALDLLAASRTAAPGEPAIAAAMLRVYVDWPELASLPEIEALLAAFPEDGEVREWAIRSLLAAGRPEEAQARLDEALTNAPGERRLTRLQRELFPAPSPAMPVPPATQGE